MDFYTENSHLTRWRISVIYMIIVHSPAFMLVQNNFFQEIETLVHIKFQMEIWNKRAKGTISSTFEESWRCVCFKVFELIALFYRKQCHNTHILLYCWFYGNTYLLNREHVTSIPASPVLVWTKVRNVVTSTLSNCVIYFSCVYVFVVVGVCLFSLFLLGFLLVVFHSLGYLVVSLDDIWKTLKTVDTRGGCQSS